MQKFQKTVAFLLDAVIVPEVHELTETFMPHIYALFSESDQPVVQLMREHRMTIRKTLAAHLGYDEKEVALIARPVSTFHQQLSDNLDRLEFVIDTGVNTRLSERKMADLEVQLLKHCEALREIGFSLYVRVLSDTGYRKYAPPLDDD